MKRKIIKQGASTLTVSLPQEWAAKHNLEPGSEVEVAEQGNALVIGAGYAPVKTSVSLAGLDFSAICLMMTSCYIKGFEEIEVHFSDTQHFNHIQSAVGQLMGFAITGQSKESCTVRQIGAMSSAEFDTIFNEVVSAVVRLSADSIDSSVENLQPRFLLIKKYSLYCLRMLNKGLVPESQFQKYSVIHSFLQIAFQLAEASSEFSKLKSNKNSRQSELKKLASLISDIAQAVKNSDSKKHLHTASIIDTFLVELQSNSKSDDNLSCRMQTICQTLQWFLAEYYAMEVQNASS